MSAPDPSLLKLLRCPQKHSELAVLSAEQLQQLNAKIRGNTLKTAAAQPILEELLSGLINAEGSHAYPIRDGIIKLIADDAIVLDPSL